MRKITLEVGAPKLEINGVVFPVLMNDAEIMAMVDGVRERCRNVDPTNTQKVLETARYLADSIDSVLGKGAVEKIANGAPVSVKRMVEWFGIITDNALAAQFDKLVEDND